MRTRHQRGSAFTLVELLVVISIIALLIMLLLPALKAARERAQVAQCMVHQRQIAAALAAYEEDHQGVLPLYIDHFTGGGSGFTWSQALSRGRYLPESSDVVVCPTSAPFTYTQETNLERFRTYGMPLYAKLAPPNGTASVRFTTGSDWLRDHVIPRLIPRPSETFLLADSINTTMNLQSCYLDPYNPPIAVHLRHQDQANSLMADGSVRGKGVAYFVEENGFVNWWYVTLDGVHSNTR